MAPPTERHDDGALQELPPPGPVHYAEQALLGALLLEPHRLGTLTDLEPGHFSNAAHGTLFAAMRATPAPDPARHPAAPIWLNTVLAAARPEAPGLNAPYLHALVQACSWPRHTPAYARMIEAEHARHRLWGAAERLVQSVHDACLPHPVQTMLAEADSLAQVVEDIAVRFPPRSGVLPRAPEPLPLPASADAETIEEERLVLATATAHPADVASVRWLAAGDFTRPLYAGLWRCLTALVQRHEPVDPVTVLWEAQQRGLIDHDSDPGEVLRLLAEPAGALEHWSQRTLQRSLLASAERTGRRVGAYARDPANTPFQLVVGTRRALADIQALRTRWQHATDTTPARRKHPRPATRAGPPTTTAPHTTRAARQPPPAPAARPRARPP
ncbi:hypothetical protein SLNWT_7018 [Streptomyces albus]|uniref:DNA helicase DnaB-like N-terminal domain-containing protein n=1 Tax=Streptomyces albus (strain ATCC 21838 / DSM 41398 / FERM P-419 / JCM 4703 / NBRC 107858) TaxID=1081613 RepID=A0A0B5EZZ4_STRA4|nr:hypothetical protein SLNWT_7018 [Streptomyces albus]AOU81697.1 hypothetical protein SLNHY_7006 [Streptomyces albus]AYN37388.1 replicative DNA helicase [Streptomyces albus]